MTAREIYAALLAREVVDIRNGSEIELWTEALDVYVADLVMAHAEVGNRSSRILDYLLAHGIAGSRSRTLEPSSSGPSRRGP